MPTTWTIAAGRVRSGSFGETDDIITKLRCPPACLGMEIIIVKAARRAARLTWLVLLLFCFPHSGLPFVLAQPSEAYALTDAVNAYRASVGLPRLQTSGALMIAAQRHAEWMAVNYTYSHHGEGGSMPQDRAAAAGFSGTVNENVAGSTTATPAEAVFFWDQSSVHRQTMRQARATSIGGGFAANDDQRLFVLLIGIAPGQSPLPTTEPAAGGTPAIDYTPPPGLVWTTNGELHQGSDYVPAAPPGGLPSPQTVGQGAAPAAVAYVMPFDLIRRAEPGPDGSIVHVVEAGQTVWAIAARYEADLRGVLAINHLPERPVLHPGDKLIIRLGEGQAPPPPPTIPTSHAVQAGESLWTIAARYRLSVDDLRAWNHLPAGAVIQPGDLLVVYPPAPVPSPTAVSSPTPTTSPPPTLTVAMLYPTPSMPAATAALMQPPTEVASVATPLSAGSPQRTAVLRQETTSWLLLLLGLLAVMMMLFAGFLVTRLVLKRHPSSRSNTHLGTGSRQKSGR